MERIADYERDDAMALSKTDKFVVSRRGQKQLRKTAVIWKLLIRWTDSSESRTHLKDMKELHPIEVAEFAKARGMLDEPVFQWWVPHILRKRDVIISMAKSRIRKTTYKHIIELPTSQSHAHEIDRKNKNKFWRDTIGKEIMNVIIDFELLLTGEKVAPRWNKVIGHLVFDVKIDFPRKAR